MSSFQNFKNIFGGRKPAEKNNSEMSIGMPTNVVHGIHVGKNDRGELEGIKFHSKQILFKTISIKTKFTRKNSSRKLFIQT